MLGIQDTWMFPSLLALFPSYAESITNFRYRQLGAAQENVKLYNHSGAIYPWTGARFGNCTYVIIPSMFICVFVEREIDDVRLVA